MTMLHIQASLVILMLAVAGGASARDVSKMGPNGNGGACPDATQAVEEDETTAARHVEPATRSKPKGAPMVRSGSDNTARPRWHSFLPGMFR